MLAEKVLAGKSKIEDYFPEYAHYTVPEDGKVFHHAGTGPAGIAQPIVPLSVSLCISLTHTHTHKFTSTHRSLTPTVGQVRIVPAAHSSEVSQRGQGLKGLWLWGDCGGLAPEHLPSPALEQPTVSGEQSC